MDNRSNLTRAHVTLLSMGLMALDAANKDGKHTLSVQPFGTKDGKAKVNTVQFVAVDGQGRHTTDEKATAEAAKLISAAIARLDKSVRDTVTQNGLTVSVSPAMKVASKGTTAKEAPATKAAPATPAAEKAE